jgi:Flp pilus assembly protein TadD
LTDETRNDPYYRELSSVFHNRARQALEEIRSRGLRDPEIEAFFSRLHWRKNPDLCIEHAEAVLRSDLASRDARKAALYDLGSSHFDQRQYGRAFPYLQELAESERNEISWMLLAICHQKKGNLPEAERLIHKAILVSPDRADLHDYLASIYREMGQAKDADRHLQRAMLLRLKVPQPE